MVGSVIGEVEDELDDHGPGVGVGFGNSDVMACEASPLIEIVQTDMCHLCSEKRAFLRASNCLSHLLSHISVEFVLSWIALEAYSLGTSDVRTFT